MRKTLLFALIGLAAGCADSGTGPGLRMSLQVSPVDQDTVIIDPTDPDPDDVPPTMVSAEGSTLRVTGYFETPCMRDPVHGTATRSAPTTLTIRIWSEKLDGACPTRPDPYTYDGRIHNLEPGTYLVIVEHERDARRPNGVVQSSTVVVP